MGCANCNEPPSAPPNEFNLEELLNLYDNPNGVIVTNPRVVIYRSEAVVRVDVSYIDPDTEEQINDKPITLLKVK